MQKVDIAELRRLHEAAMQETSTPQDLRKSMNAAYLALPAMLDELEAAREELEALKVPLAVYERHTKLIGAAEKLEQLAGKFGGQFVGTRRYNTDELLEIAAQLRREAGE